MAAAAGPSLVAAASARPSAGTGMELVGADSVNGLVDVLFQVA